MTTFGFGAPLQWKGAVLVGALLLGAAAREAGVPVWAVAAGIAAAVVAGLLVWRAASARRRRDG